jgi:hypothetical protein
MRRGRIVLRLTASLVVSLVALAGVYVRPSTSDAAAPPALATTGARTLPSTFYLEKNVGQAPSDVRYIAHTGGDLVYLTARGEMISAAGGSLLRLAPAGGALHPSLVAGSKLPGILNYFIGNDPKRWHTNVPTYGRVTYRDVYPGIDLTFHGQGARLEYDWLVRSGADPQRIRLAVRSAGAPAVDSHGALRFGGLPVMQSRPTLYQAGPSGRNLVAGGYALAGHDIVDFRVGRYDRSRTLVIDPVIMFAELLGGSGSDVPCCIQVDARGNIYIAGSTTSSNLPVRNAYQSHLRGVEDMFVLKLSPSGSLVYGTYIGGNNVAQAFGLAVDGSGRAYITGNTKSADFPLVPQPAQAKFPGGVPATIVSLSAQGNALRYSFLMANGGADYAYAIALDPQGDAYVALAMGEPALNTPHDNPRAEVLKVDRNGPGGAGTTVKSIGGSGPDTPTGIAVDKQGNVIVVGVTSSPDFYVSRAIQSTLGGNSDAFVIKLDAGLNTILFSTYLGGSDEDEATAVAIGGANNIFVTGYTASRTFPVKNTIDVVQADSPFIVKLSSDGGRLLYGTIIGTAKETSPRAIAVSKQGYATIGGFTGGGLVTQNPLRGQDNFSGLQAGFVATLGAAGQRLIFSTFLGGSSDTAVFGVAIGGSGNLFATGTTRWAHFPTTRGPRFNGSGGENGFVVKIGKHR